MIVWLDAQLPPTLALWMRENFQVDTIALRELGLRDSIDRDIYAAAKKAGAVLISKDSDFIDLVQTCGAPPQLVWLTCGNVTNAHLKMIFSQA